MVIQHLSRMHTQKNAFVASLWCFGPAKSVGFRPTLSSFNESAKRLDAENPAYHVPASLQSDHILVHSDGDTKTQAGMTTKTLVYFHSLDIRLELQNKNNKTHFKNVLVSFGALDIFFTFFCCEFWRIWGWYQNKYQNHISKTFWKFPGTSSVQIKLINGPTCFSVSGTSRIQNYHGTHPFHCTCKYCQWKKSQPTT